MTTGEQRARVSAIAAANDPVRAGLLSYALRSQDSFSRDEAADAEGIARTTAAFHLDKLAELGILEVEFRRHTDRVGPGAGRPAKFYRARADEIAASIPEHHYDLAADILAAAVEYSERTSTNVRVAMNDIATARGREIGVSAPSLDLALNAVGYHPRPDDAEIALSNCPFHHLAMSRTRV